jgi:hypothetical protein
MTLCVRNALSAVTDSSYSVISARKLPGKKHRVTTFVAPNTHSLRALPARKKSRHPEGWRLKHFT